MHWREVFAEEPHDVVAVPGPRGEVEVPRFVPGEHYAENFAKQWRQFSRTQVDSFSGTSISRDFLERLLDHPLEELAGKTVLEIGAGAGRFTEHLVAHAREVVATDLSEAIFVNAAIGAENLVVAQADLLRMPAMKSRFDLVLCRGVLQHTPDPARSIRSLYQWVAPDGAVVFDIYKWTRVGRLHYKYLWRPVIQRLFTYERFSRFLDRAAAPMLRARWALRPWMPGPTRKILNYALPVWDYRGTLPLSDEQLIEWGRLDTLDAMFATYDQPMHVSEVLEVLDGIGADVVSVDTGMNFYRTRPGRGT